MTPGTRLLNAVGDWRASQTVAESEAAIAEIRRLHDELHGTRALYPAAHAIGDRVLAEENDGSPAGLATVIAIRFTVEKVNYKLRFEDTLQKVWFDAAYVHPTPRTLPLYRAPGVSGGPG